MASITGFLRTILIILLVWYGVKIVARFFAPSILRYVSKKAQQRFGQQFQNQQHQQQQQQNRSSSKSQERVGETVIDKIPKAPKTSNKEVGEYIDYEEID